MLNRGVLVLNNDFRPLHICNSRRAISLVLSGKVDVLQSSERHIHSATTIINIPSVIKLRYYVKKPYKHVLPTKRNIFIRDGFTCQYCGSNVRLTIDHVIPQKRGGKNSWDNLVTCCWKCNNKKGDKRPEDVGLVLRSKPKKPSCDLIFKEAKIKRADWADFLLI